MKLSKEQLEFLKNIQKIGINNIVPDAMLFDLIEEPNRWIHINKLKNNGWSKVSVEHYVKEFIENDYYNEFGADKSILNSLRIYYIEYLKTIKS
jgi:hypothetical protein